MFPSIEKGYAAYPGESEYPSLWNGLIGAWIFGMQGAGSSAYDFSGYRRDGSFGGLSAVTSWVPGILGRTLYFSGVAQHVNIPNDALFSLSTTGSLTVSCWFRPEVINAANHVISKGIGSNYEWGLNVSSTGQLRAQVFTATGTILMQANSAVGLVVAGTWVHLAIVMNINTPFAAGYVNGILRVSTTTASGAYTASTAALRIGERADGAGDCNGQIDDVRIYNRELSAAEVFMSYNVPYAPWVPRRLAYYQVGQAGTPPTTAKIPSLYHYYLR